MVKPPARTEECDNCGYLN